MAAAPFAAVRPVLLQALAGVPAVAVAAVREGALVYCDAAGQAGGERADPARTAFMTASISKLMNAVLCLQLREDAKLDIDADISSYLGVKVGNPNFPDVPVTARHLLMHVSSLRDDEEAVNHAGDWKTMGADSAVTLEEYARRRLLGPDLWSRKKAPGSAPYHYSNAGMTLLGWVIEKAAGEPLQALAQRRIFDPLGMTRTKYILAEMLELPDTHLAVPHRGGMTELGHYGLAEFPAAGLRSTAQDLAAFLQAFTGPANPLLSEASVAEMLPADFTRGLAWWGRDAAYGSDGEVWQHGGFMAGVRTHLYLYPKSRTGIVILTNGEGPYEDVHAAMLAALVQLQALQPEVARQVPACTGASEGG